MSSSGPSRILGTTLPIILLAALVHGWMLFGLHHAVRDLHWPATHSPLLLALYVLAVFAPLTVQLLAEHMRQRVAWLMVGVVGALFFYFGWHHGASVVDGTAANFITSGSWFPLPFVLAVLWLLLLPFIQLRLAEGRWGARYQTLFATAWRNKLTLAEAALFTGLFWLLLFLWQALFSMIGIAFFKELFAEPIFVYPVTSLTFGFALYMIGSLERLTSVVLEQLLSVLKWLTIVGGVILALFTVALMLKLPGMIASGNRAISAAWLLWLVAVTVLLVNAAYRDGSVERPFPAWIAIALRCVLPLLVIVAITGAYALYLRIDAYGLTVERLWGCIVAAAASIYAIGYAVAAVRKGGWMQGVDRINVATALFLIGAIGLALTPVLSPYRLAAASQFALVAEPARQDQELTGREASLRYLRFDAGAYGTKKLRELANLQAHPLAADIRKDAAAMIEQSSRYVAMAPSQILAQLDGMVIHPAGRRLEGGLRSQIESDMKSSLTPQPVPRGVAFAGLFVDVNGDQAEEFLLISHGVASVYGLKSGVWSRVGIMTNTAAVPVAGVVDAVRSGDVSVQQPEWREVRIGSQVFRMSSILP